MPPLAGYWHSLLAKHGQVWRAAYREATKALEAKLSGRAPAKVEYAYAHIPTRQAVHSVARIRQGQSGWLVSKRRFDAAVRYFTSQSRAATRDASGRSRTSYQSVTWNSIRQSSGRAPFASTLRPNLTGGTLGRTAGGYSLGGGRVGAPRHFSHVPACQAHVVQNVSQAVRAFLVGGHKAQFNGVNPVTGGKKYKVVTRLQEETGRKMKELPRTTPGSHVDFKTNPTITALTCLRNVTGYKAQEQHLNTEGLLEALSTDFSRQLQELCAVLADLKRLSVLGDLPLTYEESSLRVHFPGCDADSVEVLCQELGVRRGLVVQDADFDAFVGTDIALLFPFAPSQTPSVAEDLFEDGPVKYHLSKHEVDWRTMLSQSERTCADSTTSEFEMEEVLDDHSWQSLPLEDTSSGFSDEVCSSSNSPLEYQGIEGIYRFIEQCDSARRR